MKEYTYKITGKITFTDSCDVESGIETVCIEEHITIGERSAAKALESFLSENHQFDFFGKLTQVDAETRGGNWAQYRDQNEDQTIMVEII